MYCSHIAAINKDFIPHWTASALFRMPCGLPLLTANFSISVCVFVCVSERECAYVCVLGSTLVTTMQHACSTRTYQKIVFHIHAYIILECFFIVKILTRKHKQSKTISDNTACLLHQHSTYFCMYDIID